jgi:hypothetical protein
MATKKPAASQEDRAQYRVLRAITVDNGQTLMPGEVITPGADWPFHRARQLVEQGSLLALAPSDDKEADDA